jgi:hypothetical protein
MISLTELLDEIVGTVELNDLTNSPPIGGIPNEVNAIDPNKPTPAYNTRFLFKDIL